MSSAAVISAENVSKKYVISHLAQQHTVRDAMHHSLRLLWRRLRWNARLKPEMFWALQDVGFEVKQGEVLGVIGRNGAGKSTLLKILSRITEPTTGRVTIRGRVASLLEVGTGFHPELTGRENIFLNGAILGMSQSEVRRKLDEIVAFAEVDQFIDTPVKRYSSGMHVRLAFAVAAHLEPDILIVDEVLSVGDAQFQKKCLGKLREVSSRRGRTVFFVSHDLNAVAALTQSCLLLEKGRLRAMGPTRHILHQYSGGEGRTATEYTAPITPATAPRIRSVRLQTSERPGIQCGGQPLAVEIDLEHPQPIRGACLSFQILNQTQQPAAHLWVYDADQPYARAAGVSQLVCQIPKVRLNVGHYTLSVHFSEPPGGTHFETLEGICPFEVVQLDHGTFWGWRAETCAYREDCTWTTNAVSHVNS